MSWLNFLRKEFRAPLLIVCLGVVLGYGGFSQRQTFALMAAAYIIYSLAERRAENLASDKMSPFSILIAPNWRALLEDNGLVDAEKWKDLMRQINERNRNTYHVMHAGISLTVLQHNLIYSNNNHRFFSKADLAEPGIDEWIEELESADGYTPSFYVRMTEAGYELGMRTPDSIKASSEYSPESAHIPIATLPEELFHYFYRVHDYDYSTSGGQRRFKKYAQIARVRLAECGWKEEDAADRYRGRAGTCYEHRYAKVYIKEIV